MTIATTPETPTGRKRKLAAAAMAVLLLVTFEFGVARTKWAYEMTPGVFIDSIYALEDHVIVPGPAPTVAIFGSSRLQDSVAPRLLEEQLDLGPGAVMNLAFPFGDVVASRLLYERNRDKLSQIHVAVVGVEMWDLFGERHLDPIQEYFLPMDERLDHAGKDRISLVISSVWKTYAMRKMAGYVFGGLLRGGPDYGPLAPDGRLRFFDVLPDGPDRINASEQFDDRFAELEAQDRLGGAGDRYELQRFIDLLTSDGVVVVLVHVPMRTDFVPELEARLPTVIADSRAVLASLTGTTRVEMVTSLDELGIPDQEFVDFGHAAESGVASITTWIASLLEGLVGQSAAPG